MNKQFVGKSITVLVDLVKSRAPDKMDKGILTKMTRDDVRNMSDQIFIQLPIKFQILENDEPKVDTNCELSVTGYDTTGTGTTNSDGIIEWNNHKEVSEMMILPMSCSLSYEDKTVNINITEESDKGSIIQIENGRLKGDDNMIYSLDEQIVGTWIDGSPIYRRCFDCKYVDSISFPNGSSNLTFNKVLVEKSTGKVFDFGKIDGGSDAVGIKYNPGNKFRFFWNGDNNLLNNPGDIKTILNIDGIIDIKLSSSSTGTRAGVGRVFKTCDILTYENAPTDDIAFPLCIKFTSNFQKFNGDANRIYQINQISVSAPTKLETWMTFMNQKEYSKITELPVFVTMDYIKF